MSYFTLRRERLYAQTKSYLNFKPPLSLEFQALKLDTHDKCAFLPGCFMATNQNDTLRNELPAAQAARIYKRAVSLHQTGQLGEAIEGYAHALQLSPLGFEIYNNLGVALRATGHSEAALACYRRSLGISPGSASVYTNMGNALHDLGEYARAVEAHRRAVKNAPTSAKAHFSAGRACADAGKTKDALNHFSEAIKRQKNYPSARVQYALTVLRLGDWARGFKALESRMTLKGHDPRRKDIATWDGADLDGKTILINYEGDEGTLVQYLRFARILKKRGARVLIESPGHFNTLLDMSPDIVGTPNPGAPVKDVDVQIPLLSLPRVLGLKIDTLPTPEGYLPTLKFNGPVLAIHPDVRLAVGLVWSGSWAGRAATGPANPSDIRLDDLAELFGIPGVQLVSLELGQGTKDIGRLGLGPLIDQVGSSLMDVADMAGIINQLDLVICVDSVAAHVAGAMGKPVWMMTRPGANWCWLENRNDSPWYASMSLFRKGPDEAWSDVAASLRQALMHVLKGTA